jgi:RNA polymerase-binding transcription factor
MAAESPNDVGSGQPRQLARGLQAESGHMGLDIEAIRRQLYQRRRHLLERVAQVEDDLRWLNTNVEPEMEEEGQEENVARLLARLDDREQGEIRAINTALARIATGDYGWCSVCRDLIPAARLEAVPTADRCVSCAEMP